MGGGVTAVQIIIFYHDHIRTNVNFLRMTLQYTLISVSFSCIASKLVQHLR